MSAISIQVRPRAGASVTETAYAMVRLAAQTCTSVEASFNGILIWAHPNTLPMSIVEEYHRMIKL